MRRGLLPFVLSLLMSAASLQGQQVWPAPDPDLLTRAKALLSEAPLIDGHNDLATSLLRVVGGNLERTDLTARQPELSADLPRLREGMVGGQFWSAWSPSATQRSGTALLEGLKEVDLIHQFVDLHPELQFVESADDIERLFREGKIASMIGLEGAHMIANSLAALRLYRRLGVRYMTLTHFGNTDWADAATDAPRHGGLTEFGEEVVREMNRLGIFVDLSHVSPATMDDALRVSRAPVIYSHSNAWAINAHPRNVPDHILRRVAANGGVVMVNFIAGYVPPTDPEWRSRRGPEAEQVRVASARTGDEPVWGSRRDLVLERLRAELDDEREIASRLGEWAQQNPMPRGNIGDVADHIDHICQVAGIDHVGIGSDFYDNGESSMAYGLEDVSQYPVLFAELLRRGYSDQDVKKIAGLNLIGAMREMERVAGELQAETEPSAVQYPGELVQ